MTQLNGRRIPHWRHLNEGCVVKQRGERKKPQCLRQLDDSSFTLSSTPRENRSYHLSFVKDVVFSGVTMCIYVYLCAPVWRHLHKSKEANIDPLELEFPVVVNQLTWDLESGLWSLQVHQIFSPKWTSLQPQFIVLWFFLGKGWHPCSNTHFLGNLCILFFSESMPSCTLRHLASPEMDMWHLVTLGFSVSVLESNVGFHL